MDGIHSALVESFQIPGADRIQRLYEPEEDSFEIMAPKTKRFTLIEITAFKGRTLDAKKALYAATVRNLDNSPGIGGDDIIIVLHEPPLENWGVRGGRAASEVDLGFR